MAITLTLINTLTHNLTDSTIPGNNDEHFLWFGAEKHNTLTYMFILSSFLFESMMFLYLIESQNNCL